MAAALALAVGCGSGAGDPDAAAGAGAMTGGSAGAGSAAAGSAGTSGGAGLGGSNAGAAGSAATSGSGGGGSGSDSAGAGGTGGAGSCLDGLEGAWKLTGYEAYLQFDDACQVVLFCDLVKDYHTTGSVDGDVLTLTGIATVTITVMGDLLTLLDAGDDGTQDLPFDRLESPAAIPEACYP